jgi:hypothetical protein
VATTTAFLTHIILYLYSLLKMLVLHSCPTNCVQVGVEFDLIMQQADMRGTFISTWNDWTKAIVDHALATRYTPAALKEAMRDIPKEASAAVDDIHGKGIPDNVIGY